MHKCYKDKPLGLSVTNKTPPPNPNDLTEIDHANICVVCGRLPDDALADPCECGCEF